MKNDFARKTISVYVCINTLDLFINALNSALTSPNTEYQSTYFFKEMEQVSKIHFKF